MIRSTQEVFSTSVCLQVSAWKHPSVSVRFFKQLKTPCTTVRGLLTWSHKRHLFLVSQYWKMTSSCIFFSFYYIGHIWPAYQVDQPHSQITDSILGGEWFLPCWNIWKVLKNGKVNHFSKYCRLDIKIFDHTSNLSNKENTEVFTK